MIKKIFENKKSQEEMVGFAVIVIIIAVILLIFLGFTLRNPSQNVVESFEVESYILSFLQHTTNCQNNQELLNVRKVMFGCYNGNFCADQRAMCGVLETALEEISDNSWDVSEGSQYKGYALDIIVEGESLLNVSKGELNGNYKEATQDFSRSGVDYSVFFRVYES